MSCLIILSSCYLIFLFYFPALFYVGECPVGWSLDNSRCYRYFGGVQNYYDALKFCTVSGYRYTYILFLTFLSIFNCLDEVSQQLLLILTCIFCSSF